MTSSPLSAEIAGSLDFRDLDQTVPTKMPLVEQWLERHAGTSPLAGVTALLIQHQLGSQVPMAKALIQLGLNPNQIHWLDIPYTSSPIVRAALHDFGIPKANFRTHAYRVTEAYAPYQKRYLS